MGAGDGSGVTPEDLFDRILEERLRGESPDLASIAGQDPEFAAELEELLPAMEALERGGRHLSSVESPRDSAPSLPERLARCYGPAADPAIVLEKKHEKSAAVVSEVLERLAGHRVGRYEFHSEIGRGGQGAVLAVWDADLRRNLAMKVLLPPSKGRESAPEPRTLGRFLEEAQITAQLDHPGIVPVHELGLDRDGGVYFTMKLVRGRDLRAVFEQVKTGAEGWTQTRALSVLLKVCEAMSYAHSKGVIHRDLKPSNVMVGKYGEAYVMDWGLARVLGSEDKKDIRIRPDLVDGLHSLRHSSGDDLDSPLVTMDGDVVGTPSFMPPEQARGELAAVAPHSDVYSVGAMLYQLLSGEMPYVPAGARLSNREIWAQVQEGPPKPLHRLGAVVPAELVAICEKAMARDVAARYADMGELAEDLRAYLEHRVVQAHQTGAIAELEKWVQRNRALAVSAAAAFLLLVTGLTVSLVFKARSDRNAKIATANEELAKASEQRALQGETLANRRADEVLRLSALQRLDDLIAEAEALWPAEPSQVRKYEEWLRNAEKLVAELPVHEANLAELRANALPWTEAERARQRVVHPRAREIEREKRHLDFLRGLASVRESAVPSRDPAPEEVGVDLASLPAATGVVNEFAWEFVDPERKDWGREAEGLVLSRRAVELAATSSPEERANLRDTLAWALFAAGRFEEAVAEEKRAMEEAGPERRSSFVANLNGLLRAIEEQNGVEGAQRLRGLQERIAALEAEVSRRSTWTFADSQDLWWHNQLEKLVEGLKALSDPEKGLLSRGISAAHAWGIRKRFEFAESIVERTVEGTNAAARWAQASASIQSMDQCPAYRGLVLSSQLGLLPIGRDPDSGLWEFAHLQTGEPAERGPDGKLILAEATGIVFVLLPGGTFTIGAQCVDPDGLNYDPDARAHEGPPHEVSLAPFFLSKYEMTQGQWLRFVGANPSRCRPDASETFWNSKGERVNLLYPVEHVSWEDSMAVLRRIELRLPTEAQWEYAARAGSSSVWWTGDDVASLEGAANLPDLWARDHGGGAWSGFHDWDDGHTGHSMVGSFRANAFGLHDVVGNLWEMCRDRFGSYWSRVRPGDGERMVEKPVNRVYRGGSFAHTAKWARSALRAGDISVLERDLWLGLRPACAIRHTPEDHVIDEATRSRAPK